ncbi:hypothetical protein OK349_01855 [Sphingomonas sp. BT-65]|uniref:hypothetical protein n=1 Tax=Sphingomonas sp. BT-65 TaxID=2989821 RepID=UPI002235B961|nr:hypothetical protein [Sphingomonas sp. BT-65]MCW4460436.1 hypothetical protein [Sphingomonas sp. BT-65]
MFDRSRIDTIHETVEATPVMARASAQPRLALLRAAAVAVATGLAVFLVLFALANASLRSDRDAGKRAIQASFGAGTLELQTGWRLGDVEIGAHQFLDCLILYQAIDNRAPAAQLAVTPLSAPIGTANLCGALKALADDRARDVPRFYHNYLHAHTSVTRLLLPAFGVEGLRGFYKLALSLALLAGFAFAALGLAQGRRPGTNAVWLVVFATFARWFGLESFGQSLGHGPADLVLLLFLLFLCRASASRPLAPATALIGCAVFGALTMAFEFITGGLPLGLAVTIGCVPLTLAGDRRIIATTGECALAFVVGAVTMAAAKLVLIVTTFGPGPLAGAGGQLLFRTGMSHADNPDGTAGWPEFFGRVWAGVEAMAPGMHWLALGALLLALALGGWGYGRLRATACPAARFRAVAMAGSAIVIPLWMVVFWQHTAQHAWFMDRILAWPMAAGFALFVMALTEPSLAQRSGPGWAR